MDDETKVNLYLGETRGRKYPRSNALIVRLSYDYLRIRNLSSRGVRRRDLQE